MSEKPVTVRMARAGASVVMQPGTLEQIRTGGTAKGNVLEVARLAGIMAAKQTSALIPLCHTLGLDSAEVQFTFADDRTLQIEAIVRNHGRTGVEMEALTACSVAALTVYDMCKAVDRGMTITSLRLLEKSGGRSGQYVRPADAAAPPPSP